jgi:predicted AlkP superfamily pyrophosphatase or phosphodiesterase
MAQTSRLISLATSAVLLACLAGVFFFQSGVEQTALPAGGPTAKKRKVLLIGIDGCRSDALQQAEAPHLRALAAAGTVTWDAVAGGELNGPTQQPTVSGPGWSSVLCGVWMNRHRVYDNKFIGHNLAEYPHFFRRLKEARPELVCGQAVSWPPLENFILWQSVQGFVDWHVLVKDGTYPEKDTHATDAMISWIRLASPDVAFLYFNNVDETGHATGFGPENPAYMAALKEVDAHIGRTLEAIRSRPEYSQEEWLTLVTTDHGGRGRNHGDHSPEERRIFLIASGGNWPSGKVSTSRPGHAVIPATIAQHLNIPEKPAWGWDAAWRAE